MNCPEAEKDYYDQQIAEKQINVGNQVFLQFPAVKRGQTKKFHSPWQGSYIMMTKIGNVTYHIQAQENPSRRNVVHCNHLKQYVLPKPVDQHCRPTQTASSELHTEVQRQQVPQPYVPDETDLMYTDKTAADMDE